MITFMSSYAAYFHTMPKHIIENIAEGELTTNDWFNHPDVVSGPYMVTDYDTNHYISYVANENYWKGAPKIGKMNFKILDASQVYSSLQSGEIDVTSHTMTNIPQEDNDSIDALENVNVVYGSPVTNQSVFIQTKNIPDARVRQALVYAIDRQKIVDDLLKGHGEVIDGFVSSASPYYDDSITPIPYDPEKAKELLAEAGWDGSQTLRFFVNSGDGTFVNIKVAAVIRLADRLQGSIFQRKPSHSKHIVEFMYRKRKQPCQVKHLTRLLSSLKKAQKRLQQGAFDKKTER